MSLRQIESDIRFHPAHRWESLSLIRKAYHVGRTLLRWLLCILFFFPGCSALVLMGVVIDPRRNDRPQRWLFR
ncbi:MAG: hypothetical protein ACO394_09560, partial [Blastocatellia bacterium]